MTRSVTIVRSAAVPGMVISVFLRFELLLLRLEFLLLEALQVVLEPVEALLPELSIHLDPHGDLLERLRIEPAGPVLSLSRLSDQAGELKHFQVLRDRGSTDVERLRELRDGGFAEREARKDRAASGVGESRESRTEGVGGHP